MQENLLYPQQVVKRYTKQKDIKYDVKSIVNLWSNNAELLELNVLKKIINLK